MPEPAKPANPKKTMIINTCAIIGLVVALGTMFALKITGAIPGALFGAVGGGLGGLVGFGLAAVLVKDE